MLQVKSFTFNPVQENTYVIYNDQGWCAIIDPGCYFSNERIELKTYIEERGFTPKYLLNTHCHLDHVFGNKFVHDTYGLNLHLHPKEKKLLDFAPQSGESWGLSFDNYDGELVFIDEKDRIRIGEDELTIFFTPGHSPGSICFYSQTEKFVIGGDVLFRQSIGRYDLPGGNLNTLLTSIREKLFVLPDDVVVFSGHGPETTIGYEKKFNPFLNQAVL